MIWEDHFLPEIIDPETGAVLPDGEIGELVLTSLTKEALPVIRYRTRDRTRLLPPTARSMRRMARVMGRTDDMLIIRGVNLYPSQIEELMSVSRTSRRTIVSRCGATARSIASRSSSNSIRRSPTSRPPATRRPEICSAASSLGVTSVIVCNPGAIERSVGKAKRVIDTR